MFIPFASSFADGIQGGKQLRKRAIKLMLPELNEEKIQSFAEKTNFKHLQRDFNSITAEVADLYNKLTYPEARMYHMRTGSSWKNLGDNTSNYLRIKFLGLIVKQTIFGGVATVFTAVVRIGAVILRALALLTLLPLWAHLCTKKKYTFSALLAGLGVDLFKVAFAPVFYALSCFAVLFGILFPQNGRMLFSSLEALHYGDACMSECMRLSRTKSKTGDTYANPAADFKEFEKAFADSNKIPNPQKH